MHGWHFSGYPIFRLPIWLDNVLCTGNESSLLDCSHNGIGEWNTSCVQHNDDVGVRCLGESLTSRHRYNRRSSDLLEYIILCIGTFLPGPIDDIVKMSL